MAGVRALSEAMRSCAEEGDWGRVIALNEERDARLREFPASTHLNPAPRQAKPIDPAAHRALIEQVLADNERLVTLVLSARQRVHDDLANAHNARRLVQAYEGTAGNGP